MRYNILLGLLLMTATMFGQRWYDPSLDVHTESNLETIIEFSYESVFTADQSNRLISDLTLTYQTDAGYSVGIGSGAMYFIDDDTMYLPIFLDSRVYISKYADSSTNLYFGGKVGYLYNLDDPEYSSGIFITPSLGIRKHTGQSSAINISVVVSMSKMQFNDIDVNTSSAGLLIGIEL